MKHAPHSPAPPTTVELLIRPDGQVLAHNLSPAMAAVLAEFNPEDATMRARAACLKSSPPPRPDNNRPASPPRGSNPSSPVDPSAP